MGKIKTEMTSPFFKPWFQGVFFYAFLLRRLRIALPSHYGLKPVWPVRLRGLAP